MQSTHTVTSATSTVKVKAEQTNNISDEEEATELKNQTHHLHLPLSIRSCRGILSLQLTNNTFSRTLTDRQLYSSDDAIIILKELKTVSTFIFLVSSDDFFLEYRDYIDCLALTLVIDVVFNL